MAPLKGKASVGGIKGAEGQLAGKFGRVVTSKFKIYSEDEKVTSLNRDVVGDDYKKSIPVVKGANLTSTSSSMAKVFVSRTNQSKSMQDKTNIRRKALADVSNSRVSTSRKEIYGGSKVGKGTSIASSSQPLLENNGSAEKVKRKHGFPISSRAMRASANFQKDKVHYNATASNSTRPQCTDLSTRRSLPVSKKASQAMTDLQENNGNAEKVKRKHGFPVSSRAMSASTNFQMNKVCCHASTSNVTRPTVRSTNPSTRQRRSLPVLKKATQVMTDLQENNETVEKVKRKHGFPVKTRVGGKVTTQVSNLKSKMFNERVRDWSEKMAPRGQSTNAYGSIRSAKPTVKRTARASYIQRTSQSMCTSSFNKPHSAVSSEPKAEVSTCSMTETFDPSFSHGEVLGGIPAENRDNAEADVSNTADRKRSDRRKSFTSLLISRSKLLEENHEALKQEKLPNIDDQTNPLDVADYVDDIYQYYWVTEVQSSSLANYMTIQTDVTPQMRGILVDWLIEVHLRFDLLPETLYLAVALLDRYLSLVPIRKNDMQLVGLTSLLLASKYEDFWHPRVKDLISISAESYIRKQVLEMEKNILRKLMFRLNMPTAYVFMLRFLKASQSDTQLEHLAFYLIELCLVEYEALKFRPSLLCASAVYLSRCTLKKIPAWTSLLAKHTRYEESQIRDCAEMTLKCHKAASGGMLRVTREKYMKADRCCVAAIKPLVTLPL